MDLHERDNQQNGSWIGQLGVYFQVRYERLKSSNDLESAIRYIAQANALGGPDHPRWAHRLHRLGSLQSLRFGLTGVMEDLNGAVSNLEAVNALTSNDHEEKAMWLGELIAVQMSRFELVRSLKILMQPSQICNMSFAL